jgi:hypothetical protein
LNDIELKIRNSLLEVLNKYQSEDHKLGKTFMNSNFLNGIIDVTVGNMNNSIQSKLSEFNEGRQWLDRVFSKKKWTSTTEFNNYCSQFTDDMCNRIHFPTLVRKSFITGRFDPFVHEGHDIAQDVMKHL